MSLAFLRNILSVAKSYALSRPPTTLSMNQKWDKLSTNQLDVCHQNKRKENTHTTNLTSKGTLLEKEHHLIVASNTFVS
jgi:hypothetical protein